MRPELGTACARFRLAPPGVPLAGRAGDRLGRGTGSSLEFMDHRAYVPGDDPRHIDWGSFARTDQLSVRLFREEVSPAVDIIVDLSASMAVTPEKERALRDVVVAFAIWARRAGCAPRNLRCGGDVFDDAEAVALDAPLPATTFDLAPRVPPRPRSVRVLISDFLQPGDPGPAIRRLATGAARIVVVQLLDAWEMSPTAEGSVTLVDCEDAAQFDLRLEAAAIATYGERLTRLRAAVERASRSAGGAYACVRAAEPATMFRDGLLPQGIIEPAP